MSGGRGDANDDHRVCPHGSNEELSAQVVKLREEAKMSSSSIERLELGFAELLKEQKEIVRNLSHIPHLQKAADLAQEHVTEIALIRQSLERQERTLEAIQHLQVIQSDHTTRLSVLIQIPERVKKLEDDASETRGGWGVGKVILTAIVTIVVSVVSAVAVSTYAHKQQEPATRPPAHRVVGPEGQPISGK